MTNISFESSGDWNDTHKFLDDIIHDDPYSRLEALCEEGVTALAAATPRESGETAAAWDYVIEQKGEEVTIWWVNTHAVNGFHVVIGLQYGHATGGGGYVPGYDFINPAIKPIMDSIADKVWKEVIA